MQTPRNSAPVISHKIHNSSRKASSWIWGPGDHSQGYKHVLWVPKSLTEQISKTWARAQPVSESDGECEGRRLQLSPSYDPDVRQEMKPQFLHLKIRPRTTHPWVLSNQTTNPLSKCQPPSPLLPNHKQSCALDSGQKSPKGTLWTLGLWSEARPQDVDTYTIASLSPKGFIFSLWRVLVQHLYLRFLNE